MIKYEIWDKHLEVSKISYSDSANNQLKGHWRQVFVLKSRGNIESVWAPSNTTQRITRKKQSLKDENNFLKGEQQQSILKAKTPWRFSHNYWAQKERKLPQNHLSSTKKSQLKIDREQILEYLMELLPIDAQFKDLVEVIIQYLTNRTDKVLFLKKKYYWPQKGKTPNGKITTR